MQALTLELISIRSKTKQYNNVTYKPVSTTTISNTSINSQNDHNLEVL